MINKFSEIKFKLNDYENINSDYQKLIVKYNKLQSENDKLIEQILDMDREYDNRKYYIEIYAQYKVKDIQARMNAGQSVNTSEIDFKVEPFKFTDYVTFDELKELLETMQYKDFVIDSIERVDYHNK